MEIANDTIQLAFNIGLEAARRSELIEPPRPEHSWAVHVKGITAEDAANAVNKFNNIHVLDHCHNAYISTSSKSEVTICGPPSVTAKLFHQDPLFHKACRTSLPVTVAFHAEHLDPVPQNRLNSFVDSEVLQRNILNRNLVSTSSGKAYEARSFGQLMSQVQADILQHPIRFEVAVEGLAKMLPTEVSYLAVGPIRTPDILRQPLKDQGIDARDLSESLDTNQNISTNAKTIDDIAVVGMAVRLPGSETLEEFWQVLQDGRDLHRTVPADRFDLAAHYDSTGTRKNTTQSPYGVFIDRPGYFDRHLFNMSPRECLQTDPQHRMLLLATYEALESAGYVPHMNHAKAAGYSPRVGTFIGQTGDDWREVNSSQNVDAYFIPGGMRAFGPGRLHYHFGWDGPSYSVDTACSSSASAIQLAISALSNHECDMAVSGGVNFLSAPDVFAGLSRGGFLSPTGGCKTFDEGADGYCRADGIGVVILKRYADAVANRDNIVAVLKGAVTNHSAEAVSITHPHAATQQRLFSSLVSKAGLHPNDIDYVELHGTGTQAGDTVEASSVTGALAKERPVDRPLYIGSVKPNLGHGEGASGVTSLIKAVLILRKNTIPPHIGIKSRMNSRLPRLSELNTHIPLVATPFSRTSQRPGQMRGARAILVNNFDAAGGNTSMILQDAPETVTEGADPRSHHVVAVSGRTEKSLRENLKSLLRFAQLHPETRIEDIAYTTSARRTHHAWRHVEAVASTADWTQSLDRAVAKEKWQKCTAVTPPVVFVFTGQASLDHCLALDLFRTCGHIRESILDMERISLSHGFASFLPVITDPMSARETNPLQEQLATIAVELALASFWRSLGVVPDAVIGHSLGEFAALCAAGVISTSTCLYLVGYRATLMTRECSTGTHAMLVVPLGEKQVEQYLDSLEFGQCNIACINSPNSTVVAGPAPLISVIQQELERQEMKTTRLGVPFAFHSSQMDAIMGEYGNAADRVIFSPPHTSILSTVLGRTVRPGESAINASYLKQHTRGQVKFSAAVQGLPPANGPHAWIEMGPHPTCLGLIRRIIQGRGDIMIASLKRSEPDWKVMAESLASAHRAGLPVDWREYHRPYETALRLLELPSYSFDLDNYWLQYKGNWSVTKGDPPNQASGADEQLNNTRSLCRVETHVHNSDGVTITFTIDPSEPTLRSILSGHRVNGVHLCSSAVYAEMAYAAARSMQRAWGPSATVEARDTTGLGVREMQVQQPLIICSGHRDGQVIRLAASQKTPSDAIHIQISSQDGGAATAEKVHAKCIVIDEGQSSTGSSTLNQYGYLVRARMDQLVASAAAGPTHRILKPMVYKLFSALVDYSEPYQALQEVYMDSERREAVGKVRFSASVPESDLELTHNPCWIDGMFHLSGFVLNGAETTPADVVYISHGWDSMRVLVPRLVAGTTYHSYVRMCEEQKARGGLMVGDVHVFEGDEVIAICRGIRFQRIKRGLLDEILPSLPGTLSSSSSVIISNGGTSNGQNTPASHVSSTFIEDFNTLEKKAPTSGGKDASQMRDLIRRIVASEIGLDNAEAIEPDSLLEDFGVDSLLGLSIVTAVKKQTGLVLPSSFFLTDNATIRTMEHALGLQSSSSVPDTTSATSAPTQEAEAVLLSMRPAHQPPTGMTLFLLPDGSGSAASYAGLAASLIGDSGSAIGASHHGPDAVYGLNSPFLHCPEQLCDGESTVRDLAIAFTAAIRRIQPTGPYHLGGWSIGGTYAFEVASLLNLSGDGARPYVAHLVLIDAPCPAKLPALPLGSVDLLAALGVLGTPGGDNPGGTGASRAHFEGSIRLLRQYKPQQWAPANMPLVTAIWARKGVWETVGGEARARRELRLPAAGEDAVVLGPASDWVMNPRSGLGPEGWELLLPVAPFSCHAVDGDHFSMMRRANVGQIGRILLQEFSLEG